MVSVASLKNGCTFAAPIAREGHLKRSSLHIGLRNKECKKPCQLSLKLIARTQTTHYNGEFDPGSG
jgi:hypothetical protein